MKAEKKLLANWKMKYRCFMKARRKTILFNVVMLGDYKCRLKLKENHWESFGLGIKILDV